MTMTKLSKLPSEADKSAKTCRPRKSQALSLKEKWNPNKPVHATRDEFLDHIRKIEQGPFMTLDEGFKQFEQWKTELLRSRL